MKKLFSIAVLLMTGSWAVLAQDSKVCWDFEEACANPADAFFTLCIADAHSASGSPDTKSDYGDITAVSGSKYAHMYANFCNFPPNPTPYHCEGIILKYNFIAGTSYTISFAIRSRGSAIPSETKVVLVNDMPNFGGIEGGGGHCTGTLDILPDIPANSQTIATFTAAAIPGNAWTTKTITFTPTTDFNQVWFRPKIVGPPLAQFYTTLFVDNVCVKETCDPDQFTVSVCRYPESVGSVFATINGVNAPENEWFLFKAIDCNGGTKPFNIDPNIITINWVTPGSGFTLPINSGCYILTRIYETPGCGTQYVYYLFNTSGMEIPVCNGICDDWYIENLNEPCDEMFFSAVQNSGSISWPAGTIFTFELDGVIKQSGSNPEYHYHHPTEGWHNLCVTVNQPACPPIRKCITFYAGCEGWGLGSPNQNIGVTAKMPEATFRISNPSSGTIWFSSSVENGNAYLYSTQGALIKTFILNGTDRLDVSEITTGQYILTLEDQDGTVSKLVLIVNQN